MTNGSRATARRAALPNPTHKSAFNALADLPLGGGKAVVLLDDARSKSPAGDDELRREFTRAPHAAQVHLRLRADADPDVLFRICAQLSILGCPPDRFLFARDGAEQIVAEVWLSDCAESIIDAVCRKLVRLTCIHEVERIAEVSSALSEPAL